MSYIPGSPYRKRYGDRKDGRRVRSLPPMSRVGNYIMPTRIGSTNYIRDRIDMTEIDRYIHTKRMQGLKGFGMLHVFIASYVRVISQKPGINRFISNQELYARDDITIALVIKKEMKLDAQETIVKLKLSPYTTAYDVYEALQREIEKNRAEGDQSSFDDTARLLNVIPRGALRGAIAFIRFLDNYNRLPKFLLNVSPFHVSMFLNSMGSLAIPPIYHHLYDFGNCPVFLSLGLKYFEFEPQSDGSVERKSYMDFTVSTDERICDGHYFASALKGMQEIYRHPETLDRPPETIVPDVD